MMVKCHLFAKGPAYTTAPPRVSSVLTLIWGTRQDFVLHALNYLSTTTPQPHGSGPGLIMATYDNTHRAFLQAFLSRGTLTYEDSKPLLAAIQTANTPDRETLPNDITAEHFNLYIQAVNTAISPFDLEIRSAISQDPTATATAPRLYALVNTTSDAATQLSTAHTADELAFVKRVLDAMFETHNTRRAEVLALTSMQALALSKAAGETQAATGLTRAEAERCLAALVAEGWLDLSAKGYYRLAARARMELRTWLIETYKE